ncbi:MAG TPA: right-handed parallel beta-helix repeat-containing protein [Bacteroidales bacterium]|nr:right-handed parallel beta-helix repeat-containing protein [Bacteroidales bacterium]HRZ50332.1 right-handed parallel beta-helix repeat-containing protein [Bacteroidales bacterium]
MRTITAFLLLMLSMHFVHAETIIADKQQVSGTWGPKGSPYIVQGEAIVPEGKTLTIKPGVEVKFKTSINEEFEYGGSSFDFGFLRVNGKLVARGKEGKPIVFTRLGNEGSWGAVVVNTTDKGSEFAWCKFSYGHYIRYVIEGDNATGMLTFIKSTGKVSHCTFSNGWTGINCKQGSEPVIDHCTLTLNEYGLECNSDSKPTVSNTILWGNGDTFYLNSGKNIPVSYSLIQAYSIEEESVEDKGNNIINDETEPGFIDADAGDFRLSKNSPLLKKGEKGSNIGAY